MSSIPQQRCHSLCNRQRTSEKLENEDRNQYEKQQIETHQNMRIPLQQIPVKSK